MPSIRSVVSRGARSTFVIAAAAAALAMAAPVSAATPIPRHVFAPYYETWTATSITNIAKQSGARYFMLAFLESLGPNNCQLAWGGDPNRRVTSSAYVNDIASLRALGGDVIPSFGGFSADEGGTEIADSCTDINKIVFAYEQVITKYNVSRLDMDVESNSLTNTAGIDRRNKAIRKLQVWATNNNRPLKVSYTLPTSRTGLDPDGMAVLRNAIHNGVRIDIVQPMVFDYYDGQHVDMGDSAISALNGLHSQLKSLMPSKTAAQLWALEGAVIMNGRDDYPTNIETTTGQDAQQLLAFARSKGMASLAMWAIQRDNGGCPGTAGADNCSGIAQQTWAFTAILKQFTGP